MIKDPTNVQKALVLQYRAQKVLEKYWCYSIGPKKYLKSNGFTVSDSKSIKKALVLQHRAQRVLKKHWFYSIGPKKY